MDAVVVLKHRGRLWRFPKNLYGKNKSHLEKSGWLLAIESEAKFFKDEFPDLNVVLPSELNKQSEPKKKKKQTTKEVVDNEAPEETKTTTEDVVKEEDLEK